MNNDFLKCLPLATQARLHTYTGQSIEVLGEVFVKVETSGQCDTLPLLVADGPSLISRNWLCKLQLNRKNIFSIHSSVTVEKLLQEHSIVFSDKLGTVIDLKVKLHVKENSTPKFSRPGPYLLHFVKRSLLNWLLDSAIIVSVKFSEWAASLEKGTVRICGDYKLTINSVAKNEVYSGAKTEAKFGKNLID